MRTCLILGIALLAACQKAAPGPIHPAAPGAQPPAGSPVAQNDPRASQARYQVPPLPPDAPVTRWQQFCWTGNDALAHLNEAGAQGWELVGVSIATTGDVAVPSTTFELGAGPVVRSTYINGTQLWLACFKRPLPARPADK